MTPPKTKMEEAANLFMTPTMKMASPPAFMSPAGSVSGDGRGQHVFGITSSLGGGAFGATPTPQAFVPLSWWTNQRGTLKNPWIIQVNTQWPEANRGFDIQFVEGMEEDDYSRNAFHVRHSVAPHDHKEWQAIIPHPQAYDPTGKFDKRLILMKVPSRDGWQKKASKYHGPKNKVNCPATKKAHSASEIEINKVDERQWAYHLLCFPPEVELDNQIFSNDEATVPKAMNPMMCPSAENDFGKDFRAVVLFWRIAVKGGTKISNGSSVAQTAGLFDDDEDGEEEEYH